jgi:hypothetical protein
LRHIYDPVPGSIHIKDLIRMAKDGYYVKDKPSDYVIGMILHARDICNILAWHGTLFQLPFVKGMSLRTGYAHYGQPFLGPDGLILTLSGRTLKGSENNDLDDSPLTEDTITKHPNYAAWLANALYAGGEKESYAYNQVHSYNTLKDCDAHVNSLPYTPGPSTHPPSSGAVPVPLGKKKRTRRRERSASPPAASGSSWRSSKTKKRITMKLRKNRKGKGKMSEKHINDSEDEVETADEAEADTAGSYGLDDKLPYYEVAEDDPAEGEGGEVAKGDAAEGEDGEEPEDAAAGEEGGGEAEDDATEEGGGEDAEDNAAEGDAAEREGGEHAESDAGGEQAERGAGGEQAESDPLEGAGNGDASDDDYDPSPSKSKKYKAAKRKAGAAGGGKGQGKARVKSWN